MWSEYPPPRVGLVPRGGEGQGKGSFSATWALCRGWDEQLGLAATRACALTPDYLSWKSEQGVPTFLSVFPTPTLRSTQVLLSTLPNGLMPSHLPSHHPSNSSCSPGCYPWLTHQPCCFSGPGAWSVQPEWPRQLRSQCTGWGKERVKVRLAIRYGNTGASVGEPSKWVKPA